MSTATEMMCAREILEEYAGRTAYYMGIPITEFSKEELICMLHQMTEEIEHLRNLASIL